MRTCQYTEWGRTCLTFMIPSQEEWHTLQNEFREEERNCWFHKKRRESFDRNGDQKCLFLISTFSFLVTTHPLFYLPVFLLFPGTCLCLAKRQAILGNCFLEGMPRIPPIFITFTFGHDPRSNLFFFSSYWHYFAKSPKGQ
jgi:hypothetical protein